MRAWWTITLAIAVGLILTGLVDAGWYTDDHGGALWPAAGVVVLVIALLILAPEGRDESARAPELVVVALSGVVLTALFWFRARAGLSGGWLSGIELTVLATFGWAWPALLVVVLYRRFGEGWRPASRRRLFQLTGTAFLAGAVGWLLHLALWEWYESAGYGNEAAHPLGVHGIVTRPTETPIAIAALGGPWALRASPTGIVARHPPEPDRSTIELELSGRLFPGMTRQLSWRNQGTVVESSQPRVITATTDDQGRWRLHPRLPGPAIVTIGNGRARTHIGVWVTNRDGRYGPFEVVTDRFRIEPVSTETRNERVFHRQTLRLRNESDRPVLGPVYAVFHTSDESRVVIGNSRRTTRIEPTGLPWVEALGPAPGNRAPVIDAGQSIEFDVFVLPALTREWLHFNVDLIQAFDPL